VSQSTTDDAEDARLAHLVRTGINLLQISVGQRWTWYVRTTACWLSGLIGLLVVSSVDVEPPALRREYVLAALITGGFFAWRRGM